MKAALTGNSERKASETRPSSSQTAMASPPRATPALATGRASARAPKKSAKGSKRGSAPPAAVGTNLLRRTSVRPKSATEVVANSPMRESLRAKSAPAFMQPQEVRVRGIIRRLNSPTFPSDVANIVHNHHIRLRDIIHDAKMSKLKILTKLQLGERKKFAEAMSATHPNVGWYITWDNGFRPFLVIITPIHNSTKLSVTAYRPPPDHNYLDEYGDYVSPEHTYYTALVAKYEADKVFLGKGDVFPRPDEDISYSFGNSILVNISSEANTYAFIGFAICEFTTYQPIDTFWSIIGSNGSPYPCASTRTCVYILDAINEITVKKRIPTISWKTIKQYMPDTKPDLSNFYDEYYGEEKIRYNEYGELVSSKVTRRVLKRPCVIKHGRTIYN